MAKLSIVDTVKWIATIIQLLGYGMTGINLVPWNIYMRPLQKGIFLPPALFANAHLLLNKLRFAASLKNKNLRFFARGLKLCKTLYMFFLGIFLWFAVGMMWKDRAIMVVHVGAFVSLLVGFLNS